MKNKNVEGGRIMLEAGHKACSDALNHIHGFIDALDLTERQKVGAGLATMTMIYGTMLKNVLENAGGEGDGPLATLASGLFGTMISDPLGELLQLTGNGGVIVTGGEDEAEID